MSNFGGSKGGSALQPTQPTMPYAAQGQPPPSAVRTSHGGMAMGGFDAFNNLGTPMMNQSQQQYNANINNNRRK
jgi:hypothetical protein